MFEKDIYMFERDINDWLCKGYTYEDIAREFSNSLNKIQKERERVVALERKRELMRDFLETVQSYVLEFHDDNYNSVLVEALEDPITDEDVDRAIVEIDSAINTISQSLKLSSLIAATPAPVRTEDLADDAISKWLAKHNL